MNAIAPTCDQRYSKLKKCLIESFCTSGFRDPCGTNVMQLAKHLKGIACGFVVLIALVVGAREIPECINLTDDVSNDGIAVSLDQRACQASSRLIAAEQGQTYVTRTILPGGRLNNAGFPPPFSALGKAGPELLRLLSLQLE